MTERTETGHIFAWMTGELVTPESAEHGDAESRGWIDPRWSMRTFHDSRNDVRPVVNCRRDDPNLADYVAEALGQLGAYADNGDGTYYGQDGQVWDYAEPGEYTYAIHFVVKDYRQYAANGWQDSSTCNGWTETNWHPHSELCLTPTGLWGGVCGLAPGHPGHHCNVNDATAYGPTED